jgi:hypothetical protein
MLTPAQIIERLETIEHELADKQPDFEKYAESWTRAKREQELAWARAYTLAASSTKNVTDRKAAAIEASAMQGMDDEARYVGLKGVIDVLQTRSMIGMALLKAHGRA